MLRAILALLSLTLVSALSPASALADRFGERDRARVTCAPQGEHRPAARRGIEERGRHGEWDRHRHRDRRPLYYVAPAPRVVHRPAPVTYVVVQRDPWRERVVYVAPRPPAPSWSVTLSW